MLSTFRYHHKRNGESGFSKPALLNSKMWKNNSDSLPHTLPCLPPSLSSSVPSLPPPLPWLLPLLSPFPPPSLFPFCLIYKSHKQYILIILILLKLLRRFLRSKYLSIIPVLYYIHAYVCHRAFWYHSRDPATVFDWHISSHYTCFQENSELDISQSLIPPGLLQMCHDGLYWNNLLRIIFYIKLKFLPMNHHMLGLLLISLLLHN